MSVKEEFKFNNKEECLECLRLKRPESFKFYNLLSEGINKYVIDSENIDINSYDCEVTYREKILEKHLYMMFFTEVSNLVISLYEDQEDSFYYPCLLGNDLFIYTLLSLQKELLETEEKYFLNFLEDSYKSNLEKSKYGHPIDQILSKLRNVFCVYYKTTLNKYKNPIELKELLLNVISELLDLLKLSKNY